MRLFILSCSEARHVAFREMKQYMTICLELVAEVDAELEPNKSCASSLLHDGCSVLKKRLTK